MKKYSTSVADAHEREEELQWARLLEKGTSVEGMALVFIQKLCTAVHEIAPAIENGCVNDAALPFLKGRIINRMEKVIAVLEENGLSNLAGIGELRTIVGKTRDMLTLSDLAKLEEAVHQINHTLCDSLEGVH